MTARDQTPRQAAGHYGKWPNWANALGQPPARLAGGLCQGPQASTWGPTARKSAVCGSRVAQNAPFRHVAAREARDQTPRQPAGHYGKWLNWANVLGQPPASLRGVVSGSAGLDLGPGLTEKRSLGRGSLMARPELGRDTPNQVGTPSGCQLWAKEIPGLRVRCTCSSCHSTKAQLISL